MSTIEAVNWTCPFCGRHTTIAKERVSYEVHRFDNASKYGRLSVRTSVVVCPNPDCKEVALKASMGPWTTSQFGITDEDPTREWQLLPEANVQQIPDYVPSPIRQDYREAALIRKLSPKASATLARRCLQGMIRDFWGVSKNRLKDEIDAIRDKLDSTTGDAIDAVRTLGNIGAHMEKDINTIVDVDPGEAELLLQLIETLIKDWYVTRHTRAERMAKLIEAAAAKK
jgi:hypothetical protein